MEIQNRGNVFGDKRFAISKGVVIFGSSDQHVYAVNCETGKDVWRFKTGHGVDQTGCIFNGTVYIGSHDANFYALDFENGREIWRFKTGGRIGCVPKEWNGNIYFGCADHFFYCIKADTGELVWKFKTNNINWGNPEEWNGIIFFGSTDTHFYALDAVTGKLRWLFQTSIMRPSKFWEGEKLGEAEILISRDKEQEEEMDAYAGGMEFAGNVMMFTAQDANMPQTADIIKMAS